MASLPVLSPTLHNPQCATSLHSPRRMPLTRSTLAHLYHTSSPSCYALCALSTPPLCICSFHPQLIFSSAAFPNLPQLDRDGEKDFKIALYKQIETVRPRKTCTPPPEYMYLHHQAEQSSRSFRALVLIGVAAACAILTPFSARGLCAAGRTPCSLSVGRDHSGCSPKGRALQRFRASLSAPAYSDRVAHHPGLSASRKGYLAFHDQ